MPYLELISFARIFGHIRQPCRVMIFSRVKLVNSRYGIFAKLTFNRPIGPILGG
jgi:hypothetical protein